MSRKQPKRRRPYVRSPSPANVMAALGADVMTLDALAERMGIAAHAVAGTLAALECIGKVMLRGEIVVAVRWYARTEDGPRLACMDGGALKRPRPHTTHHHKAMA